MNTIRNYAWRVMLVPILLICAHINQIYAYHSETFPKEPENSAFSFELGRIHTGFEPERTTSLKAGLNNFQTNCVAEQTDWSNTENLLLSDDAYMQTELQSGQSSSCLYIENFNFQIPTGSAIDGVKINIEGYITGASKPTEITIALVDEEDNLLSINYSGKVSKGKSWPQASKEKLWKYGIIGESWLSGVNAALLNSSGYRLKIQLKNKSNSLIEVFIDQIQLEIIYTPLYTLCKEDCGILFVDPPGPDYHYEWQLPEGMEITSEYYDHHIINFKMTNRDFGVKEICVEATSPTGEKQSICRNILIQNCNPSKIGDLVWLDENLNGLQDQGEKGISFVTVHLMDLQDNIVSSTASDTSGYYLFTDIDSGFYYLQIAYDDSLTPTLYQNSTDTLVDNDLYLLNGALRTDVFYLAMDQESLHYDMGFIQLSSVGDFVWLDENANGLQDGGETGVAELPVELYKEGLLFAETITDSNGLYIFEGLEAGVYNLCFQLAQDAQLSPANDIDTTLNSDINDSHCTGEFIILTGQTRLDLDAGFYYYGSVGNRVWLDLDENGIQDINENGIDGLRIDLYQAGTDQLIQSTVTDPTGAYIFNSLIPDNYYLIFQDLGIFEASPFHAGFNKETDSDINWINDNFYSVDFEIKSGQNRKDIDAGFSYIKSSIGNYLWLDINENGLQDPEEIGLNGIEIQLYNSDQTVIATTFTSDLPDGTPGYYLFDGLNPGNYYIGLNMPDLYVATIIELSNLALNSDITHENGINSSFTFSLDPNQIKEDIDIGLVYNYAQIGDWIWLDENADGIQDAGETGLNNIHLALLDADKSLITTTITHDDPITGISGYYTFENLLPGIYYVEITELDGNLKLSEENNTIDDFDSDFSITDDRIFSQAVELFPGTIELTIDGAVSYKFGSIHGETWLDLNQNGIFDAGEENMKGIPVFLFESNEVFYESAFTDANGIYEFNEIPDGDYYLIFGVQPQYLFTDPGLGNGQNDSDVTGYFTVGSTDIISILNGMHHTHVNAGYVHNYGTVGDFAWLDGNQNGIQDMDENGINGITVTLFNKDHEQIASMLTEVQNDLDGQYKFEDVLPGTYYILFEVPDTYEITVPDTGSEFMDSDVNHANGLGTTGLFTISGGQQRIDIDAGYIYKAIRIGDFVWLDENQNGIQEPEESGLNDLTLNLYDSDQVWIESVITHFDDDSGRDGYYEFIIQLEDSYYIELTYPGEYLPTVANATDEDKDSDLSEANGKGTTDLIQLILGDINYDIDFGLILNTGIVGDFIWIDTNQNGLQDVEENGIDDVQVKLFDENGSLIATTSSYTKNAAAGYFEFTQILPGTYYLEIETDEQFIPTILNGGDEQLDSDLYESDGIFKTANFELLPGQLLASMDLGLQYVHAGIQGLVWEDLNEDGIYEESETRLSDIIVELYTVTGELIVDETTNEDGIYQFSDIPAGNYYLKFYVPASYTTTIFQAGTDGNIDSDIDSEIEFGTSYIFELMPGELKMDLFAGLISTADNYVIGDHIWIDSDKNGIQDALETGLNDVQVSLYDNNSQIIQTTQSSDHPITGEPGYYYFSNIPSGIYHVHFNIPADYVFTQSEQGSNDLLDSDVNMAFGPGTTSIFYFNDMADFLNVDAGVYLEQSSFFIGDRVWLDDNKNGIQDLDEPGLNGIKVILFDENGIELSDTETASDPVNSEPGMYRFTNVPSGSYYIRFVISTDYVISEANAGNDDFKDSDITGLNGPGTTDLFYYVAGLDYLNIDAGIYPDTYSSIGNYVWEDMNGNGLQDFGEPGLNEITIKLYKQNGEIMGAVQTETDPISLRSGYYLFNGVPAGTYYIEVDLPQNYFLSEPHIGNDPEKDSDITHENGGYTSSSIQLGVDDYNNSIDIGLYQLGQIGDFIWEDLNSNGVQDTLETGLDGILVELYDTSQTLLASTISAFNEIDTFHGYYSFEYLDPGNYFVKFNVDEDAEFSLFNVGNDTLDSDVTGAFGIGTTSVIELNSGENKYTVDAGISFEGGYINGNVWIDTDGDGVWDAVEEGMNDVLVRLNSEAGTKISEILCYTNAENGKTGYYEFNNVPEGSYYVEFVLPVNYVFSQANVGSDDTVDSEVDHSYGPGTTSLIVVENEITTENIHAAIYITAGIGDLVWFDDNKNGLQDSGEQGAPNVEVQLLANGFNLIETTFTDTLGNYSFTNLNQGIYAIKFIALEDYGFTARNVGPDDTVDSDVGQTGKSPLISLAHGASFMDLDAGLVPLANMVGNLVWMDENDNEIQDENESGIAGSDIYLINAEDKMVGFTQSDESGNYQFYNLNPGVYHIRVVRPELSFFNTRSYENKDIEKEITTPVFEIGETDFITDLDIGFSMTERKPLISDRLARIEIYPNPFQRELNLKVAKSDASGFRILITDLKGSAIREIESSTYDEFQSLELSELPTGNYLINLIENGRFIEKVMVYKAEE
jgi:protocatechuate 3,4-dioxygenase beta subunit